MEKEISTQTSKATQPLTWEQWLLSKELKSRTYKTQQFKWEHDDIQNSMKIFQEKQRRKELAIQAYRKWLHGKNTLAKHQAINQESENAQKLREENNQKKKQEKTAQNKFHKWKVKKLEEAAEKQKLQQDMSHKLYQQMTKQKQKNEEAFVNWNEKLKTEKQVQPFSYAYNAGQLIGYYDLSRNPPPGFFNPEPWYPPDGLPQSSPNDNW